jgi:uncharacterized protein YqiB (DUF1249 family)
MAHYRQRFNESDKHLGAWDLWDDENKKYVQVEVTIDKFVNDVLVGSMGTEKKVFVKLKEYPKLMVTNVTNFKRLSKLFNSVDEDDFVGKRVVLCVEKVKSPEGQVDALRFSTRPIVTPTLPPISAADFPKAIASIEKGSTTVEKIMSTRSLTPEQIKALNEI